MLPDKPPRVPAKPSPRCFPPLSIRAYHAWGARFPGLSGLSGRVFRRSGKKSAKKFEEIAEAGLQSPEDVLS